MPKLFLNLLGMVQTFPMGRDSVTFWDKGTEVPSLSGDKILPRDGKGWGSLSKSKIRCGTGRYQMLTACQKGRSKTGKDGLKQENNILKQEICFSECAICNLINRNTFCPGTSQDFCSCPCPRTKGHRDKKISLSRDVPWKR